MLTNAMSLDLGFAAAPLPPLSRAPGVYFTGGIDMQKFRRAVFVTQTGTGGAGATVAMNLEEANLANFADAVLVPGASSMTLVSPGGDNKIVTIEVNASQMTKRYLRCNFGIGVAAMVASCTPIACNPASDPASASDVAAVAQRLRLTTGAVGQWSIHGTSAIVNEL